MLYVKAIFSFSATGQFEIYDYLQPGLLRSFKLGKRNGAQFKREEEPFCF